MQSVGDETEPLEKGYWEWTSETHSSALLSSCSLSWSAVTACPGMVPVIKGDTSSNLFLCGFVSYIFINILLLPKYNENKQITATKKPKYNLNLTTLYEA